jgi:hypothetical protein
MLASRQFIRPIRPNLEVMKLLFDKLTSFDESDGTANLLYNKASNPLFVKIFSPDVIFHDTEILCDLPHSIGLVSMRLDLRVDFWLRVFNSRNCLDVVLKLALLDFLN